MAIGTLKKFVKAYFPKSMLSTIKTAYFEMRYVKNLKKFKGENVYCPCCNKYFFTFKKFLIIEEGRSEEMYKNTVLEVVCPYCNSFPRHRILCDFFEKNQLSFSNALIFAPPYGIQLWFKINKISYITADLFDRALQIKK